jgi:hypothetical protein
MTLISLKLLAHFLNKYPLKGRVADYGGTEAIGAEIVKRMLSLNNVSIVQVKRGPHDPVSPIGVNLVVNGTPKKKLNNEYIVLDYDNGVDLMKPVKGKKFDGGICMDLLEHTENPFIIAKNITDSLNKGAVLFVTVPWVWELHYYPKDYWRFAPQGLEQLFPKMKAVTIEIIRDESPEETLPRHRLVAIFKKK